MKIERRKFLLAMAAAGGALVAGCAGTQFDPEVVDAFRDVLAERQHVPRFAATSTP